MAFLSRAFLLLTLAVVCIQGKSGVLAVDVPDRCWCLGSLVKYVPREEIEEFSISSKRSKCDKVEIILILKPVNNSSEGVELCLSPETKQGKNLQICWNRKNINNAPKFKISNCFENHK